MANNNPLRADQFELYDLEIIVESIDGHCTCDMAIGDAFHLNGGKISIPEGKSFCVYALQSTLPLLPAKQRRNHPADWMETDSRVICPDPACKLIMRIDRKEIRVLDHDEVSPIPWDSVGGGGYGGIEDSAPSYPKIRFLLVQELRLSYPCNPFGPNGYAFDPFG